MCSDNLGLTVKLHFGEVQGGAFRGGGLGGEVGAGCSRPEKA